MPKRKSPVFVKIIACLLLLGSFACFFLPQLPWLKLSADVGPDKVRMNPGELIQAFTGMDAKAAKDMALERMSSLGLPLDTASLSSLLDRVLDGHFRLLDFPLLCGEIGVLCRDLQRPDVGRQLDTARLVLWIVIGLLVLLGVIALICLLTDHRWGILPYFLLAALITAGLYLLRAELNRTLVEESDALLSGVGLSGLIGLLGVDVELVKMGIGALLCPFLALLAMLLLCIRTKKRAASPYPARREPTGSAQAPRPREEGWTCPNCGRICERDGNFCKFCGTERPRLPGALFCPSCGVQLTPGATFCSECGSPVRAPRMEESTIFRMPGEDGR